MDIWVVFKGSIVFLLFLLKESLCLKTNKWPSPTNKTPIELDLTSKESTSNYKYSTADNADVYVALGDSVFASVKDGDNFLWVAYDYTEYASQVLVTPGFMLSLILLDGNIKHYNFVDNRLVEVGFNELDTCLYIDYKLSTYEYDFIPQSFGYLFQAKSYFRFKTVKDGKQIIFVAKTPKESAYLVSVTNDKQMTMLLLNGETRKFKFLNHGWVPYDENVQLPKLSKLSSGTDPRKVEHELFIKGLESHQSGKFNDCSDLIRENAKLKKNLKNLDDELSELKEEYEHFRSRLLSVDYSLNRVVEFLGGL